MLSAQVGVIPARYASQRFPGKPLALIAGKPMILRTFEQAKLATSLHKLIVATDDDRIAEVCRNAGADVVMTSPDCPNGMQRPVTVSLRNVFLGDKAKGTIDWWYRSTKVSKDPQTLSQ